MHFSLQFRLQRKGTNFGWLKQKFLLKWWKERRKKREGRKYGQQVQQRTKGILPTTGGSLAPAQSPVSQNFQVTGVWWLTFGSSSDISRRNRICYLEPSQNSGLRVLFLIRRGMVGWDTYTINPPASPLPIPWLYEIACKMIWVASSNHHGNLMGFSGTLGRRLPWWMLAGLPLCHGPMAGGVYQYTPEPILWRLSYWMLTQIFKY